jgi:tRNA(Ile)-lysidine synthase
MAASWAQAHGRRLVVLTVDHRLRPESRAWTQACASLAQRLGLEFRPLDWTGDKPAQGIPAAARAARHRLLAEAARELGARVILLGHTASDLDEAAVMRAEGSSTPSPREWAPSPAWPEGRGVFLLRPMLSLGRAEIRQWLTAQGETWIEDPSNDDLRFARARARAAIRPPGPASDIGLPDGLADLARAMTADTAGVLSIPREALSADQAPKLIAAASLCAAGTDRPPRGDRLDRLTALLRGAEVVTSTLCGARIEADESTVRFMREPGEIARRGSGELTLTGAGVWDGRFEIDASRRVHIARLAGRAARLSSAQRQALGKFPAGARGGLPAVIDESGAAASPVLGPVAGVSVRPLALDRLLAACGAIDREP